MSWLINGIPMHPLLVHAAVVAIPVVALLAVGAAWSTRLRIRLGLVLPVLASVTFVATALTAQAGEALAEQVPSSPTLTDHTEIADIAVAGAFLLLAATWWQWIWHRRAAAARTADSAGTRPRAGRGGMATTIAVVQTAVAVFALVAIVIVGDTGAQAVWSGRL